jgi:hypothetical protein
MYAVLLVLFFFVAAFILNFLMSQEARTLVLSATTSVAAALALASIIRTVAPRRGTWVSVAVSLIAFASLQIHNDFRITGEVFGYIESAIYLIALPAVTAMLMASSPNKSLERTRAR